MATHYYLVNRIHLCFFFFDKCNSLDRAAPPTAKYVTKCVCKKKF